MKTEQIKFENERLELSIRRPTHFVTIFLLSAATLCLIAPPIIFLNMMIQPEDGTGIQPLTAVLSLVPVLFGLYLLRIFIWNFYGREVYVFDRDRLLFWSDYKFFKTEKKEFKTKGLKFSCEHSGFENERKSVLLIQNKKQKHKSAVELSEEEAEKLTELLNQKLNQKES